MRSVLRGVFRLHSDPRFWWTGLFVYAGFSLGYKFLPTECSRLKPNLDPSAKLRRQKKRPLQQTMLFSMSSASSYKSQSARDNNCIALYPQNLHIPYVEHGSSCQIKQPAHNMANNAHYNMTNAAALRAIWSRLQCVAPSVGGVRFTFFIVRRLRAIFSFSNTSLSAGSFHRTCNYSTVVVGTNLKKREEGATSSEELSAIVAQSTLSQVRSNAASYRIPLIRRAGPTELLPR